MRRLTILVVLAVAFAASGIEAAKPNSKPVGSKPTITKTQAPKGGPTKSTTTKTSVSKGSGAKSAVGKVSHSKSLKTTKSGGSLAKGGSTKSTKVKSSDRASLKLAKSGSAKSDTKAAKADARTTKAGKSEQGSTTSPTGPTPTIDFTATDVGQKLQKNGALQSKIEAKLLAAGYTGSVYEAAYGFKNMGQLNAATNMVQNHGYDFALLKLLMTGSYVDPKTHTVYRAQQLPDGTMKLVQPELATNPVSTLSLGQAKQAIVAGAEMPELPTSQTTTTSPAKTQR